MLDAYLQIRFLLALSRGSDILDSSALVGFTAGIAVSGTRRARMVAAYADVCCRSLHPTPAGLLVLLRQGSRKGLHNRSLEIRKLISYILVHRWCRTFPFRPERAVSPVGPCKRHGCNRMTFRDVQPLCILRKSGGRHYIVVCLVTCYDACATLYYVRDHRVFYVRLYVCLFISMSLSFSLSLFRFMWPFYG